MGWWEASLNWLRRASKCGKTSLINVVEVKHISDMLLFFLFRMLDIVKTWIRLYVDAADLDNLFISKNELHKLCKTSLNGGFSCLQIEKSAVS
uniref:Uncharacterized protein n=1 Tax=Brassica oleracea var. oleracea TaxID=109376 RepID=A0A0D3A9K3_BRAOL